MIEPKAPIIPDYELCELEVPHLGVTLRTLLSAAAKAAKHTPKRTWTLRYKDADIGRIKIKL